jgi:hypothetical protein
VLKLFVFLSWREAGDVLTGGSALDADAGGGFRFGAGFSQDDHGVERLGVEAGDKVDVAGIELLPELADLKFGDAHGTDIECRGAGRGCQLPGEVQFRHREGVKEIGTKQRRGDRDRYA